MANNVQEWISKESERNPLLERNERGPTVKVYRRRWLMLTIFSIHIFIVNWMWATFSPVADLIACYYDLDLFWINMLSLAAMIGYVVGFLPSSYFLDYCGLRLTAAVGGCLNAAAAWCRYAGAGSCFMHASSISSLG